jgi:UDP-glucose 4-epimerase
MKILITGDKGFIGSKLRRQLAMEKHIIYGIDLVDKKDILETEFPEVDLVYHLAAQTSVIDSLENYIEDAKTNIIGTLKVIEAYPNTRIIYTTSAASINPISPYGISKMAGELYLKALREDFVICRLPNVYDKVGKSIIAKINNKEPLRFFGNCIRDYVHVNDIVDGLLKARYWQSGEYSLGSGIKTTLEDLMYGALPTNKDIIMGNYRKGEQIDSTIPNTTPNWEPTIKLNEYL